MFVLPMLFDVVSVRDAELCGKRVFVRVDFNVPVDGKRVLDCFKIVSVLPTLRLIHSKEPKSVVIGSHFGRPRGRRTKELSLRPVYTLLRELLRNELDVELRFDEEVCDGSWILLENLRFKKEESLLDANSVIECKAFFGRIADIAIVDAFGCLHRRCGSIEGTGLETYGGLLLEKELSIAQELLETKIDIAIFGGKKIKDKIATLEMLLKRAKCLFIVGGLSFSFMKYLGVEIGRSVSEEGAIECVEKVYRMAREIGTKIVLPVDFVVRCGDAFVAVDEIPSNGYGVDIGQRSVEMLRKMVEDVNNVFWNGPPGIFEGIESECGTKALVRVLDKVKRRGGRCFCGGGETAAAVGRFSEYDKFTHVSTGGGVLMKLLGGGSLPGLDFLMKEQHR